MRPRELRPYYLDETDRSARTGGLEHSQNARIDMLHVNIVAFICIYTNSFLFICVLLIAFFICFGFVDFLDP